MPDCSKVKFYTPDLVLRKAIRRTYNKKTLPDDGLDLVRPLINTRNFTSLSQAKTSPQ